MAELKGTDDDASGSKVDSDTETKATDVVEKATSTLPESLVGCDKVQQDIHNNTHNDESAKKESDPMNEVTEPKNGEDKGISEPQNGEDKGIPVSEPQNGEHKGISEPQNGEDKGIPVSEPQNGEDKGIPVSEPQNGEDKGISEKELSEHPNYEIIDGKYYYTDTQSGLQYVYDDGAGEWVVCDHQQIRTDEEGRTYYYAEKMYLCRDAGGHVFFLDKNNEWVPWGMEAQNNAENQNSQEENSKWYFHQGNDMFYRDKISGVVYRLNKDKNEWEVYEGKIKRKRPRIDQQEEFDTDEDDDDDDEIDHSFAPPGARNDPNIEYDGSMYTKRDPGDNMVYEWDVNRRAWFPKLDEDFMATYQLSYGFNPDGTKNENPLKFDDEAEEAEAARQAEEDQKKALASQPKKKQTWFQMDEASNTKVYVSNLPDSTTEEEFLELMGKCGMILKDLSSSKYKIKMYRDSEGNFKGDALCTYIKKESVDLALQILDDYQVGNKIIHVEQAKFQQKGEYNPKLKPPKKKKKELEKLQKKQEKLFDWRPEPMRGQRQKHERTVIIRNVFDPKEFENSVEKILTHKEAMRNQCLNFGEISKFDLHDLHPEGIVQVTFLEVEAADMCAATLNNRLYLGRNLKVATWDGKEKFKIEETEAQREERLKKWDKFLETGDDDKKKK